MKKFIVLIYLLFGLLTLSMSTAIGFSYELQVTFATNPIIVPPGTNGYIEVNLKNIGSGTVTNIELEVKSWDSSVIQPRGNWEVIVGDLEGGDSTSEFYEFYVSSTATPALYQVVFEISSSAGDIRQTAMVKVEDSSVIDLVSVKPSSINIGELTTLLFNVTNNGGSSVSNVLFTWEDPSYLILPVGSDNRITISSIPANNYTEIPIELMASPSIVPGVYPLTITIEFYDRTGTKQTITTTMGLQIGGTTDFEIVLQQSVSGTTSLAIANIGANTASSVIVSIPQQANYIASGASSVSLGNLDAGDYTLASFTLSSVNRNTTQRPAFDSSTGEFPSDFDPSLIDEFRNRSFGGGLGNNNLIVEISYTDLFSTRQTVQKEVSITSISSGSTTSDFSSRVGNRFTGQTSEGDSGIIYIIIGIVGIIIIIAILKTGKSNKIKKLFKGKNK